MREKGEAEDWAAERGRGEKVAMEKRRGMSLDLENTMWKMVACLDYRRSLPEAIRCRERRVLAGS